MRLHLAALALLPLATSFQVPASSQPRVSSRFMATNNNMDSPPPQVTAVSLSPTHLQDDLLPTEITAEIHDDTYQWMRQNLPVQVQYILRDSGLLRIISDGAVPLGIPSMAQRHPEAMVNYLRLTGMKRASNVVLDQKKKKGQLAEGEHYEVPENVHFERLQYGDHAKQIVDIMEPFDATEESPLVVFVHGGAWGSGFPDMYRMVAAPFVAQGMRVAVLGYRTYPDAQVPGQMNDLESAMDMLSQVQFPNAPIFMTGHSSGAHIMAMSLLTRDLPLEQIKGVIGLSGIYDIVEQHEYEKRRGLDRFSPLVSVCGGELAMWKATSPTLLLKATAEHMKDLAGQDEKLKSLQNIPFLMAHGAEDTTVPFSSSVAMAEAWNQAIGSSHMQILKGVGHADMVLELMFGGPTRGAVMDWMETQLNTQVSPAVSRSVPEMNVVADFNEQEPIEPVAVQPAPSGLNEVLAYMPKEETPEPVVVKTAPEPVVKAAPEPVVNVAPQAPRNVPDQQKPMNVAPAWHARTQMPSLRHKVVTADTLAEANRVSLGGLSQLPPRQTAKRAQKLNSNGDELLVDRPVTGVSDGQVSRWVSSQHDLASVHKQPRQSIKAIDGQSAMGNRNIAQTGGLGKSNAKQLVSRNDIIMDAAQREGQIPGDALVAGVNNAIKTPPTVKRQHRLASNGEDVIVDRSISGVSDGAVSRWISHQHRLDEGPIYGDAAVAASKTQNLPRLAHNAAKRHRALSGNGDQVVMDTGMYQVSDGALSRYISSNDVSTPPRPRITQPQMQFPQQVQQGPEQTSTQSPAVGSDGITVAHIVSGAFVRQGTCLYATPSDADADYVPPPPSALRRSKRLGSNGVVVEVDAPVSTKISDLAMARKFGDGQLLPKTSAPTPSNSKSSMRRSTSLGSNGVEIKVDSPVSHRASDLAASRKLVEDNSKSAATFPEKSATKPADSRMSSTAVRRQTRLASNGKEVKISAAVQGTSDLAIARYLNDQSTGPDDIVVVHIVSGQVRRTPMWKDMNNGGNVNGNSKPFTGARVYEEGSDSTSQDASNDKPKVQQAVRRSTLPLVNGEDQASSLPKKHVSHTPMWRAMDNGGATNGNSEAFAGPKMYESGPVAQDSSTLQDVPKPQMASPQQFSRTPMWRDMNNGGSVSGNSPAFDSQHRVNQLSAEVGRAQDSDKDDSPSDHRFTVAHIVSGEMNANASAQGQSAAPAAQIPINKVATRKRRLNSNGEEVQFFTGKPIPEAKITRMMSEQEPETKPQMQKPAFSQYKRHRRMNSNGEMVVVETDVHGISDSAMTRWLAENDVTLTRGARDEDRVVQMDAPHTKNKIPSVVHKATSTQSRPKEFPKKTPSQPTQMLEQPARVNMRRRRTLSPNGEDIYLETDLYGVSDSKLARLMSGTDASADPYRPTTQTAPQTPPSTQNPPSNQASPVSSEIGTEPQGPQDPAAPGDTFTA